MKRIYLTIKGIPYKYELVLIPVSDIPLLLQINDYVSDFIIKHKINIYDIINIKIK